MSASHRSAISPSLSLPSPSAAHQPADLESWVQDRLAELFPNQSYSGRYLAPLLWQRGIGRPSAVPNDDPSDASSDVPSDRSNTPQNEVRDPLDRAFLAGFLHPDYYQPTSPFAFGEEMTWAIARLQQARDRHETVTIWGDFDADGLTATAVLWDGLRQFFAKSHLTYTIPNRLTESHGLNISGLEQLAQEGCDLIITCDTGSTNLDELAYAQTLGLDVIITDHHTLADDRPDVVALINPRTLASDHPLAHLSGVAVAYKLVEALYETLPDVPQQPLERVLDLVAIGLITDLVELKGDCRYLAQRGIQQLQTLVQPVRSGSPLRPADTLRENQGGARGGAQRSHFLPASSSRPGISQLLKLCKRTGDRPTDISFGIGPRINAISRIHGDATFAIELLTSQDGDRCRQLAEQTELANSRRKALQRDVINQVTTRLAELDLSTTQVIVLADPQWSIGVLGLVAGQIAQEYQRPTILLSSPSIGLMDGLIDLSEGADGKRPLIESVEFMPDKSTPDKSSPDKSSLDKSSVAPSPVEISPVEISAVESETVGFPASTQPTVNSHSSVLPNVPMAKGSARSVRQINLYDLVHSQSHLLHRFGGHPFAAGLSIPVDNIPLFRDSINRQCRTQYGDLTQADQRSPEADLTVTVAELGRDLFRELKLLEPCGMGNPVPRLLIQNCEFKGRSNRNIKDFKGGKLRYIKTDFKVCDRTCPDGFPGTWWGHYQDELPDAACDAIVELDFNSYAKHYEIRLLELHSADVTVTLHTQAPSHPTLVDLRPPASPSSSDAAPNTSTPQPLKTPMSKLPSSTTTTPIAPPLVLDHCPQNWTEWEAWAQRSLEQNQPLAIAFSLPHPSPPAEIWKHLVGIAKYLSRTQTTIERTELATILGVGDRVLSLGFTALAKVGFHLHHQNTAIRISAPSAEISPSAADESTTVAPALQMFLQATQEEQFQQQYFAQAPVNTLKEALE